MTNMFGVTGIQVKIIDIYKNDMDGNNITDLNLFLEEYDGNIIDIRTEQMVYGVTRFAIIYKAKEND